MNKRFSVMILNKNQLRSNLTDNILCSILRLATTKLEPNVDKIVDRIQVHPSVKLKIWPSGLKSLCTPGVSVAGCFICLFARWHHTCYYTIAIFIWHFVIFRSSTPRACTDCRLKLIGRLKSHGVWVCVTGDEHLVLFHLVRAQEQMLFARMMAGHVLPVENFQQPLKLDVRCVFD